MAAADLIPVNIVTGFLGSGKTTLLRRLLASPELANTAVLVNELGEVGLDHLLLRHVDESTVVLPSGCVCCALRADLTAAIRDLYSKRERGTIPRFDRLAIETTGRADPAPIFEPAVDPIGPDQLFAGDPADPSGTRQDARRWLGPVAAATPPETGVGQASAHDRDVYAFSVTVDRALDWTAFGIWLTMLLHAHGEDILRVKGLLQVVVVPPPVLIHGVQQLVHPPVHLDGWPTAARGTRLVFIVPKLPRQVIERSLAAFTRLAAVGERVV